MFVKQAALLVCCFLVSLSCVAEHPLNIAVASNFLSTAKVLKNKFNQTHPVKINLSSASTGKHYLQILNGAPFDIFLAADAARPALLEKQQKIIPGSRFTYAYGKLAVWKNNTPKKDANLRVAIANPKLAPYGLAAKHYLKNTGLLPNSHNLITTENVNQLMPYIRNRAVDIAIISLAQALQLNHSNWSAIAQNSHPSIEQQAVLLSKSTVAKAFVDFMRSEGGHEIIQAHGYGLP